MLIEVSSSLLPSMSPESLDDIGSFQDLTEKAVVQDVFSK